MTPAYRAARARDRETVHTDEGTRDSASASSLDVPLQDSMTSNCQYCVLVFRHHLNVSNVFRAIQAV
jgi:hypothetical protein